MIIIGFHSRGVRELQLGLTFLGTLGGDDYSTVGAARTVQGGSGGAFEDIHAGHIIHIDGRSGSDGTIDYVDGLATLGVAVGRGAAENDGTFVEGGTTGAPELGTSHFTGKGVTHVGAVGHGDLLLSERLGRITDGLLLTRETLGGNNYLVQELSVFLHRNADGGRGDGNGHGRVADAGSHQRGGRCRDVCNGERTVFVGDGTEGRATLNHHVGAHDGCSCAVKDRTLHGGLSKRYRQACKEASQKQ